MLSQSIITSSSGGEDNFLKCQSETKYKTIISLHLKVESFDAIDRRYIKIYTFKIFERFYQGGKIFITSLLHSGKNSGSVKE